MIEKVIVAAVVLWALVYCGFKLRDFVSNSRADKPIKCSCSSCPYTDSEN